MSQPIPMLIYDHGLYRVYGATYENEDGQAYQTWTWIGQGPVEDTAPIMEAVHGPFPDYESAVDDARLVHGVTFGRLLDSI